MKNRIIQTSRYINIQVTLTEYEQGEIYTETKTVLQLSCYSR